MKNEIQLIPPEQPSFEVMRKERKHTVSGSLMLYGFPRAEPTNDTRYVDANDYDYRQSLRVSDNAFESYFIKSVLDMPQVRTALKTLYQKTAVELSVELCKRMDDQTAMKSALSMLYGLYDDSVSIDTIYGDVFRLLLGNSVPDARYIETSRASGKVVAAIAKSPHFNVLKKFCNGCPTTSAIVALKLLTGEGDFSATPEGYVGTKDTSNNDTIAKAIAKAFSWIKKKGESQDESKGDDGESQGESKGNDDGGEDGNKGDGSGESSSSGKDGEQEDSVVDGSIDEAIQDACNEAVNSVSTSKSGDEVVKAQKDLEYACGKLAGTGAGVHQSDLQRLRMATDLMETYLHQGSNAASYTANQFKRATELLGRLGGTMRDGVTAANIGSGEVIDIGIGGNMQDVIPSELAALAMPELEDLFLRKLHDEKLLVQRRTGFDSVGNGPIVALLDVSDSTDTRLNFKGKRVQLIDVINAFGIALVEQAAMFGRDLILLPFDTSLCSGREAIIPYQRLTVEEIHRRIRKACSNNADGGTSFSNALRGTVKILEKHRHEIDVDHVDILFITDGYGGRSQTREELGINFPTGTRVFGLFITPDWEPDEQLGRIEEANAAMFDSCTATRIGDLDEGFEKFYAKVIKDGLYSFEEGH